MWILKGAWEFTQPLGLDKILDCFPRSVLLEVLQEYGILGYYGLFSPSTKGARACSASVILSRILFQWECVRTALSPILFITFINTISRHGQGAEGVWFGDLTIRSLLFADDVLLLPSKVWLSVLNWTVCSWVWSSGDENQHLQFWDYGCQSQKDEISSRVLERDAASVEELKCLKYCSWVRVE